jgi:polysaccharide export outer membrane protein
LHAVTAVFFSCELLFDGFLDLNQQNAMRRTSLNFFILLGVIVYYLFMVQLISAQTLSSIDPELLADFAAEDYSIAEPIDFVQEYDQVQEYDEVMDQSSDGDSLFGSAFFNANRNTLSTNTIRNIPPSYTIGPGDEITVFYEGNFARRYQESVQTDGNLHIRDIGPLFVMGVKASELNNYINEWVTDKLLNTQVYAYVSSSRPVEVFISGEVSSPGMLLVNSYDRLFDVLSASGGITQIASLRSIILIRDDASVVIDAYDYFFGGDVTANPLIHQGDMIIVPPAKFLIQTIGEFRRNAIYELKNDETFDDLIRYSSGLTSYANLDNASINRASRGLKYSIPLRDAQVLMDGDIIVIPEIFANYLNTITVHGAHPLNGISSWSPDLKIGDLVDSESFGDLDLSFVAIERKTKEFLVLNLTITANRDFMLEEGDKIFFPSEAIETIDEEDNAINDDTSIDEIVTENILDTELATSFSRGELRSYILRKITSDPLFSIAFGEIIIPKLVSINGQVRDSGDYPFFENMTVSNLIDMANGINGGGSISGVQISKLDKQIHTINLYEESSYLLDPGDSVNIMLNNNYRSYGNVTILGEVQYPGIYALEYLDEPIESILNRAGGALPSADLEALIYTRQELIDAEFQSRENLINNVRGSLLASLTSSGPQQLENSSALALLDNYAEELRMAPVSGRLTFFEYSGNVPVLAGDTLTIPKKNYTVSISGEIVNPINISTLEAVSLASLVDAGGGMTEIASDDIIVVDKHGISNLYKYNTREYRRAEIEPGSSVIVLPDLINEFENNVNFISGITQIIYQLAIAASSVKYLGL